MPRFRFPLETLLRWQRYRQRLAELEQARAFRQWWDARQQLLALQEHAHILSQVAQQRLADEPSIPQAHTAWSDPARSQQAYWFLLGLHLSALHQVEELARAHETQQRQVWEQRHHERLALARRTEMLQLLRQQALASFRRELDLYEQRILDEAALRAWHRYDLDAGRSESRGPVEESPPPLISAPLRLEAEV
ncbi:MAG: hypothetical protein RMJ19_08810 [Gemmatales bacterium]|nr:hypothetical protein [Gemmatales bacterium]MCS7160558.1 hypothetical protein [Gemmatales bacterium]MDW8175759.1 hypothetical protein [Gemmatales bacterium]MDW8222293.1 hypothetical protein [Gemmatales bacterium]